MDKVKEFLNDLQQNWDNSYWWADHQWLMYVLLCFIYYLFYVGLLVTRFVLENKLNNGVEHAG